LLEAPVTLYLDRVAAINPPPPKKATWSGDVMLGANLESGNSDKAGFSVGINARRKAKKHRFEVGFLYNYAKEEGELSTKNTYGKLKYDYFVTPRFYTYLSNELLYDAFKDLQLRTVVGPGAGYQLWDDEITSLALEAGVAYYNEDHKKGDDNAWTTGRLAANLRYNFTRKVIFTEQIILYPSMGTFGEFTLRNEAALTSPLAFGWALRLTSIIEHDSDPEPGIKKTDYDLLLGLQYGF
jgi:putative salt-induced outer membrane protein YdiY